MAIVSVEMGVIKSEGKKKKSSDGEVGWVSEGLTCHT